MAAKVLKGLGIGGKKKAPEPAVAAEQKGPVIKQLGSSDALDPRKRRRLGGLQGQIASTILSDKLGA